MTIITRQRGKDEPFPPIPKFSDTGIQLWWDWYAYYEDDEESGRHGEGDTQQEAIDDLERNYGEGDDELRWRYETGA